MKLTIRQKKILNLIVNSKEYITINYIAEQLDVSSRTILRETSSIEQWVNLFSCKLDKKTGFGLKLIGDDEALEELKRSINESNEEKIYTKHERKVILISELLKLDEPVKIFYLTRKLNVAESTVSADLNIVEKWFKESGLSLVRKSGVGIYIEGNEDLIRKATIRLLYENIDYKNMLDLITNDSKTIEKIVEERVLGVIDKELIKALKESFESLQEDLLIDLPDNIYIALLIHVSIVIQRIRNKDNIKIDFKYIDEIKLSEEYKIAKLLGEKISKDFEIEIPEQEIAYIAMRLIGLKDYENSLEHSLGEYFNLDSLLSAFIEKIEVETGKFINTNSDTYKELMVHLNVAIKRIKLGIEIRNPLLDEIKSQYSDLYDISKKCSKIIEESLEVKVPEDEIGFIAIHIGAILERNKVKARKIYKAIIVCPTGIGASILLASKLKKNFDFIEIVDKVSALNLKKINLIENRIDLIISTIKLKEQNIKTVVVSSLLKEKDKELILEAINELEKTNKDEIIKEKVNIDLEFKEKISSMQIYNTGILNLLNNFFYLEEGIDNIENLIEIASEKLPLKEKNKEVIEKDLIEREKKGSTIFDEKSIMLLHCRTEGVKELCFGVCKFNSEIDFESNYYQGKLKGAIIMLGPQHMNEKQLEIMGAITTSFVEKDYLLEKIMEQGENYTYNLLNNILKELYENKR